jgi:hypothetical protein
LTLETQSHINEKVMCMVRHLGQKVQRLILL